MSKEEWAKCSEDECENPVHGRGMCQKHYMRMYDRTRGYRVDANKQRRDYRDIDYNDFWEWTKKELKLA